MKTREIQERREVNESSGIPERLDLDMMLAEMDQKREAMRSELEENRTELREKVSREIEETRETLREMAVRQKELLREKYLEIASSVRDLLPRDLTGISVPQLTKEAKEKSPEVAEILARLDSKDLQPGLDLLRTGQRRTRELTSRARERTPAAQKKTAAVAEFGADRYIELRDGHERIGETREQMSDEQLVARLQSGDSRAQEVVPVVEKLQERGVYVTGVLQVVGKRERGEDGVDRDEKVLSKRYGEAADSYLEAAETVAAVVEDPSLLEAEVGTDEVLEKLGVADSDRPQIERAEKVFAEIDAETEREVVDGSPEWGSSLIQSELSLELSEPFEVAEGEFGVYYKLGEADLAAAIERGEAKEVTPGIYKVINTESDEASGLIYVMGEEQSLSESALQLEIMAVAVALSETGFETAHRDLVIDDVRQQVREEFGEKYDAVVEKFFNLMLGEELSPSSDSKDIENALQGAVATGIDTRVERIKLDIQNLLSSPMPLSANRSELTATFMDSRQILRGMDNEMTAMARHLEAAGYSDEDIRFLTDHSRDEVKKQMELLDRLDISMNDALEDFPDDEFRDDLFKRFREVPPEKWETEIEAALRAARAR